MAITLNNGFKMPIVGLGVWRMEKNEVRDLILNAIQIGYRHFDCAADYQNEAEVGEALAEAFQNGLVKREDLFITTKLWNSDHGHVQEACKDSLKKLRLDYLDLYLVHFPVATKHTGVGTTASALDEDGVLDIDVNISLEATWHAMEDLVSTGLVRSIGISNYDVFLTRDCLAYSKIKPAVNQIETHPYFQRDSLVKFCQKHGVCVTAHTPLGGAAANTEWFGTVSCLEDQVLKVCVLLGFVEMVLWSGPTLYGHISKSIHDFEVIQVGGDSLFQELFDGRSFLGLLTWWRGERPLERYARFLSFSDGTINTSLSPNLKQNINECKEAKTLRL